MIKIFIPQNKTKNNKPGIRGLWLNDDKKLFYDYLKVKEIYPFKSDDELYHYLDYLKKKYNQEALFFIYRDKAYIFYNRDKIEALSTRHIIEVMRQGRSTKLLKDYLKNALNLYSGVTVYIKRFDYILECWSK